MNQSKKQLESGSADQQAPLPAGNESKNERHRESCRPEEDSEANFLNLGAGTSSNRAPRGRRNSARKKIDQCRKSTMEFPKKFTQMNDIDFDELLECAEENIEHSAFFASSLQLMGIIDSTIGAIDERLTKKKARIMNLTSAKHKNGVDMEAHQHLLAKVH